MEIDELVRKIKNIEIQGATAIAAEGLKALKEIGERDGFGKRFSDASRKLVDARPTGIVLYNCVSVVESADDKLRKIDELLGRLKNDNCNIGRKGSEKITGGDTIMTHCHSSAVVEIFKEAKRQGKKFRVIVTETRPLYQGLKTANDLKKSGIDFTYCIDSAAGYFMPECTKLLFGSDAFRRDGIYNKIGTYLMALMAKERGVEVVSAGSTLKLDFDERSRIEMRPAGEVAKEKFDVRNPAFDLTPWKLVDFVATEDGLKRPKEIVKMLDRSSPSHP